MRPRLLLGLLMAWTLAPAAALAAGQAPAPKLAFPLACVIGRSCEVQNYMDRDPGPGVLDYRCKGRSYNGHGGVDIRLLDMAAQRAGVDVLAAAAGRVARLRDGMADISIRAANAPSVKDSECGNGVVIDHGGGWETQYCHVARGSVRVKVGDQVAAGQPIARVGLSGQTEFPHLHLTVRHGAQTIDPFAPDMTRPLACGAQPTLWDRTVQGLLAYKAGAVLNAGFAGAPVTMEAVEAGGVASPSAGSPYVVAYVRLIGLQSGDLVDLAMTGPDGVTLARTTSAPLDHDKALYIAYVGKKRPAAGWARGSYRATVTVRRAGAPVLTRPFQATL